jgi:hypothetical protein
MDAISVDPNEENELRLLLLDSAIPTPVRLTRHMQSR